MSTETHCYESIVYKVYEELKSHIGKAKAISAKELSTKFSITERALRNIIHEIREDYVEFEHIISSGNTGYYICKEDEFNRANMRLESQAFSLLKVSYANKKRAAKDGQFILPLDKYCREVFEAFGEEDNDA